MNESAEAQRDVWAGLATGYGFALVLVPIVTLEDGATVREVVTTVVAAVLATLVGVLFLRRAAGRSTAWAGPLLIAVGSLMYAVTPAGLATVIIALLVGAGAGLTAGGMPVPGPRWAHLAGVGAGAMTIAAAWVLGRDDAVALVAAVLMSVAAVVVRACTAGLPVATGPRRSLAGVALFGALALVVWTGMNDPQLSWFGPVSANGPRDVRQVAITFDDGPNDPFSLDIAAILDDHGVKGTFFEVGKALDAEPEVARRLMDDGHLLGNHSYHHDYWRWLDPRYPELDRTQQVFKRAPGRVPPVLPAAPRPTHAVHEPADRRQGHGHRDVGRVRCRLGHR